ncbi:transcriptional regulator [Salmonella enterica subsp. enterica serovar Sundsvall]|nr:transcriptional regulator [Salmonella enterica subsp. enterica serovar Sundsvall]EEM1821135.1 transcriptional regulator [Salmonella enterica subsp. enterica serovar Abaetetuba]
MIYAEAISIANSLVNAVPLLGGSTSRKDYKDALNLVGYLIEHEPDSPLIDMLTAKIDRYEDEAPELAEFNANIASTPGGVAMLRVLMEQYHLAQGAFENEIGKRSLVCRILNGQRRLALDHARVLARRFDLPVSEFID